MKTINIGVFNPALIYSASPYCGDNIFAKGLELLDNEVNRFDYRATKNPNPDLLEFADRIKPDLFLFGKCESIYPETIRALKHNFPNAIFCKWAADMRAEPTEFDLAHLKYMDLFAATYAGEHLKKHKAVMPKDSVAMSIMTFTDSDFYKSYSVPEKYKSDVLWTGRLSVGDNEMRNEIIERLVELKKDLNMQIYGLSNWLGSPDYQQAICGAKIGIGSNSFNRRKYSSDRLGNYMACGTFYLTQYIEGIEECFTKGENLEWFHNVDEMEEQILYYLDNEKERISIAKKGQEFILKHFDAEPLVSNILNTLKTKKSQNSWDEIY